MHGKDRTLLQVAVHRDPGRPPAAARGPFLVSTDPLWGRNALVPRHDVWGRAAEIYRKAAARHRRGSFVVRGGSRWRCGRRVPNGEACVVPMGETTRFFTR